MTIIINCKQARIIPCHNVRKVSVELADVRIEDILDGIPSQEIIKAKGVQSLLDAIGIGKIREHFGLNGEI